MKKIIIVIVALASFSSFAQTKSQRIIIKLNPGISTAKAVGNNIIGIPQIDRISSENNTTALHKIRTGRDAVSNVYVLTFPESSNITAVIKQYIDTGLVAYAEQDAIGSAGGVKGITSTPNDVLYNRQWGLHNDGSFALATAVTGADMQMEAAWDIEQGSSDITVATMDSGMRLSHPEFNGRLWVNSGEVAGNGIDDDNNGYIDDINGWDFVNIDNQPIDDMGHGTNVTGIIAANGNNGIGYTGIDRNCKLMTLKGLDAENSGLYSWWTEAIYYAADNGANAINLSVGGNFNSAVLKDAIDYALQHNVVIIACMMNFNNSTPYYPANFAGVIAVGSTNPDDSRTAPFFWSTSSGSNYGSHISVVAPGNYIYGLDYASNTNYDSYWGGTSQATPAVTGIVSLLLAQDATRTPAQIKAILEETAEDQIGNPSEDIAGFDVYYGHGRVNALSALSQTLSLKEEKFTNLFTIYPNPSEGNINISLTDYPAEVTVHNMLGQAVLNTEISSANDAIAVNGSGVYIVSVKSKQGTGSQKIVIK